MGRVCLHTRGPALPHLDGTHVDRLTGMPSWVDLICLLSGQMEKINTEGYIPLNNSSGEELRFAIYRNVLAIFTQE